MCVVWYLTLSEKSSHADIFKYLLTYEELVAWHFMLAVLLLGLIDVHAAVGKVS